MRDKRSSANSLISWGLYGLIGCLVLYTVYTFVKQSNPVVVPYGQFKQLVKQGKVKQVKLSNTQITGETTVPVTGSNQKTGTKFQTPRVGVERDPSLYPLLEENKVPHDGSSDPGQDSWIFVLPIILIVSILVFFIVRKLASGGSAMTFGRSRAKLWAQEDIHISFEDVAGIDEAVEELREVVDFLRTPERYQAIGGRIPKGVLLVGQPGTGKTLLAKAVAGEAGVAFFSLTGSDFVEMFVGVGAARVRDLFAQAEQRAPCIIFIDELDALGKVRGNGSLGGHEEREQTLNQLLAEMDGFDSNRGVIIMAATNRPETLDPALLRAGRFDRTVVVDRPDINGREAILKVHIRSVKVAEDLELRSVAALTPGFVGADLANLVNEAALLAARGSLPHVGRKHFDEAIERGVAGLERKQRVMMPEEKRRIAYHECGHAIVAYLLPGSDPVHKVSIIPRGVGALGYTLQRPLDDRYLATKSQLENRICVLLGGTIAEELVFPETSTGCQNDLQRLTQIARSMVQTYGMSNKMGRLYYAEQEESSYLAGSMSGYSRDHSETTAREIDLEVRHIVDECSRLVREILVEHRDTLEKLSLLVLEKEVIDADELKEVMDGKSPHLVPGTSVEPTAAETHSASSAQPPQVYATEPEDEASTGS